jgi:hypothetical protein
MARHDYAYTFLIDGAHWVDNRANLLKAGDGYGGLNSLLRVRGSRAQDTLCG